MTILQLQFCNLLFVSMDFCEINSSVAIIQCYSKKIFYSIFTRVDSSQHFISKDLSSRVTSIFFKIQGMLYIIIILIYWARYRSKYTYHLIQYCMID